jgi:hypothetical protein
MNARVLPTASIASVAALVALVLGYPEPDESAASSSVDQSTVPGDNSDQIRIAVDDLVECIRDNGAPEYPDIEIGDDGLPVVPAGAPPPPAEVEAACAPIVARIDDLTAPIVARIDDLTTDAMRHAGAELERLDPYDVVLDALDTRQLVALGEFHLCQEYHDFLQALLLHPELPAKVDDIVVEFGNALYQDVADRFLLELEPVSDAELSQIWRNTIGGRTYWDAPVYEQFFRTVRAVNRGLPEQDRIRVLLGDPPVDFTQLQSAADADELPAPGGRDTFYADLVEREVLAEARRALLIAGGGHLHRGVSANDNPEQGNAGTLLSAEHPDALFVIEPLPFNQPDGEDPHDWVETAMASWPRPSMALIEGTWLAAQPVVYRALEPDLTFGDQVDAVLWLGPETTLTASQADPEIYRSGDYATELARRSTILSEIEGQPIDYIAEGLALSTAAPGIYDGRNALAELYAS